MSTPDVGDRCGSSSAWYRWSSTPDELASAYARFDNTGEIPVLRPGVGDRQLRWSKALDWYGRGGVTPPQIGFASEADLLACVTPEFWSIVNAFAALTGRAAVQLQAGQVPGPEVLEAARTVTLIGRANHFQMAYLQRLADSMTQPWGLLPAVDMAGLSFALAKCVADAQIGTHRWVFVDAADQRTRSYCSADSPLDAVSTVELLTAGDWDVLALRAHGENGHCNLKSHVLCGLVGPTEITIDGRPLAGCSNIDGIRTCKRLNAAIGVLGADEIRARRLLLFTCTNFSVAGDDLYPSNVSLIVSALEGYAAGVLSCDGPIRIDEAADRSLVELAASGSGLAALREIENDHHLRDSGSRPYFVAGDANNGMPAPTDIRPDTDVTINEPATVMLATLEGFRTDPDSVVSVSPSCALAVRGSRMIRVIGDNARMPVRVSSADALLRAHRTWAADFTRRLAEARRITFAFADFGFDAEIPGLESALDAAHRFAHRVARTAESSVRAGVWAPTLDQVPDMARRLAVDWDKAMARAVADGLPELVEFDDLLLDGLSLRKIDKCGPCDYCHSPLRRYEYVGEDAGAGETHLVRCPLCGPQRSFPADGPRARVELPDYLVPEKEVPVRVVVSADLLGAQIVLQYKDNGRGELWWRHLGTIDAVETDFAPIPPAESAADLATLRVVIVSDLRLSYYRLRRPCFVSR
jgi:hypothetical protein